MELPSLPSLATPFLLIEMSSLETVHLLADIITLSLFFASCIIGLFRISNLLIFCLCAIKRVNLIGQPVLIASPGEHHIGRVQRDRLAELTKNLRRILRWSYIPYILRHFLWHKPEEINVLLKEAEDIAHELGVTTRYAKSLFLRMVITIHS